MFKRVFFTSLFLISTNFFSQSTAVSPFSFTGFGEKSFKGNSINRFMGGIDLFTDSIHANLKNPAGYAKLKVTAYSLGLNYNEINLKKTNFSNENLRSASLEYFSVAIPTKKFGFGFGIVPYSSVGYKLESKEDTQNPVLRRFNGSGGINKAFFSLGFNLTSFFSFGATFNYNFGKIISEISENASELNYGTYLENSSYFSGFDYQLAANLTFNLKNNFELQSYFSISPVANLISKNSRIIYTRSINNQSIGDFREINLNLYDLEKINIKTFSYLDVGLGFGKKLKWSIGGQYTLVDTSNYKNDFLNYTNLNYSKGYKISMGGFYIPNYLSISEYWKRVAYRAGLRIERQGILVNNSYLIEKAFSFGVSLPVAGYSNTNIGFEIGERRTQENSLFKEAFWSIRLGFSLIDIWFIKRKYN